MLDEEELFFMINIILKQGYLGKFGSWLRYPSPRLLIRYEDMLDNPANILKSTILFINKFIKSKIEIKDDKILKVMMNKFENLQKFEMK